MMNVVRPYPAQRARASRLLIAIGLALVPTSAFAQGTPEQQQACTPDAIRLCAGTIPDVAKTTACMKAHVGQLSPRCQAAFNEATPKAAEPKPASKLAESKQAKHKQAEAKAGASRTTAAKAPEPKRARAPTKSRVATREERRSRAVLASRQGERQVEERRSEERQPGERLAKPVLAEPVLAEPVLAQPILAQPVLARPSLDSTRVTLATMCRRGLIDAYTCTNTVPGLGLGE